MAQITAALIKEVRDATGAGMMDVKKALTEAEGDIARAKEIIRASGIKAAGAREGRKAQEGLIASSVANTAEGQTGYAVELNSETDFVSKNEEFVEFVEAIAAEALVKGDLDMDVFLEEPFQGSTVKEVLTAKVAKIGENLNIRRYTRVEEDGVVYTGYIHGGGRIGVVIGIKTDATPAEVEACGRDVAMQVASMNPKFVDEDGVDPEYIENEKKILTEQVLNEGKKPEMVEKIVAGKIKKELKEVCLVDQPFVKDSDLSVGQYVEKCAKEIGKDMKVVSMVRFEVGEGIEKKEDDFAAEVAAAVQG